MKSPAAQAWEDGVGFVSEGLRIMSGRASMRLGYGFVAERDHDIEVCERAQAWPRYAQPAGRGRCFSAREVATV